MNKAEFTAFLENVCGEDGYFPKMRLTPTQSTLWWRKLQGYSRARAETALESYATHNRIYPAVGDLLELLGARDHSCSYDSPLDNVQRCTGCGRHGPRCQCDICLCGHTDTEILGDGQVYCLRCRSICGQLRGADLETYLDTRQAAQDALRTRLKHLHEQYSALTPETQADLHQQAEKELRAEGFTFPELPKALVENRKLLLFEKVQYEDIPL